jgi:hypothetical protein
MGAIDGLGGNANALSLLSQRQSIDRNGEGSVKKAELGPVFTVDDGTTQGAGQPDSSNSSTVSGTQFASSLQSLFATQMQGALIQAQSDQGSAATSSMATPPYGGHGDADALFKALDTSGTGTLDQQQLVSGLRSQPSGGPTTASASPPPAGPGDAAGVASVSPTADDTATDAVDRLLKDFFGMNNQLASGALSARTLDQLLAQQQQQQRT